MGTFYKYQLSDFVEVPAYKLRPGDEMAYGIGTQSLKYGVVRIDAVMKPWDDPSVLLQYRLPVGATAYSSESNRLNVTWRGKVVEIHVNQDVPLGDRILIRKRSTSNGR